MANAIRGKVLARGLDATERRHIYKITLSFEIFDDQTEEILFPGRLVIPYQPEWLEGFASWPDLVTVLNHQGIEGVPSWQSIGQSILAAWERTAIAREIPEGFEF